MHLGEGISPKAIAKASLSTIAALTGEIVAIPVLDVAIGVEGPFFLFVAGVDVGVGEKK